MSSNDPCDKGPIQSYAELQAYMDCMVNQYGTSIAGAPHHAFWNTLTYEQFTSTTGSLPGVKPAVQILVIGNGAGSNIVQALLGTAGTPFDPNGGQYGQMPADGTGPWTPDQIQPLIDWIDAKCPNNG